MIPFNQTVLLWRLHRGLAQSALAIKAGIPRSNLSDIERGKKEVSLKTVRALAQSLDLKPGVLVDGIGPMEVETIPSMTRVILERIADAAAFNKHLSSVQEQKIVEQLREILSSRLEVYGQGLRKGKKRKQKFSRSWISLSYLPSSVLNSLIERVIEKKALKWKKDR
ncbi:MAG: helix-turn-helix transcriptional regulator [Elusimicrobia bacterium]|nr:helix-turn-helix transcriptional regulator [Elusimicrobiota bacterium]